MTNSVYNLANYLTASRIALAIVLLALIGFRLWVGCLVVFILAAITDWLDGLVARKHNLVSSLGRVFDPLADKVIVCGAFIMLLNVEEIAPYLLPWMVALIVCREFIVTGVRGFMEQQGIAFGADWMGKVKMVLQCTVLIAAFVLLMLNVWTFLTTVLLLTLIYAMVLATALSGLQYLWRAAKDLK